MTAKNIEVVVVRSNPKVNAAGAVPLVQKLHNFQPAFSQVERDGTFVRFISGIAFYLYSQTAPFGIPGTLNQSRDQSKAPSHSTWPQRHGDTEKTEDKGSTMEDGEQLFLSSTFRSSILHLLSLWLRGSVAKEIGFGKALRAG